MSNSINHKEYLGIKKSGKPFIGIHPNAIRVIRNNKRLSIIKKNDGARIYIKRLLTPEESIGNPISAYSHLTKNNILETQILFSEEGLHDLLLALVQYFEIKDKLIIKDETE